MATVLIIDDNADSRAAVAVFLEKAGHVVRRADNGRVALEAVHDDVPDAVLLDVRMPQMDGIAVLEALRSYLRWATVPVAIFTAYPEDPRLWHVDKRGVARVFVKSRVSLDELLAWVERCAVRALLSMADPPPSAQPRA